MASNKPSSSPFKVPHRSSAISPGIHPTPSFASLRQTASQNHATPLSASVDRTSAFAETGEVQTGKALSFSRRARDDWIVSGQEKALASDPKFRKYSSLVERTLLSIDQVNEWADFITFLAKLLKTLQSHPQYPIIPHKLIVAKRLSQCLNPALPQGVHQRALDVYAYILTTIGQDGLRRDLQVWSTGLFPFFQYAATAVQPIVLGLFEKFYLPLKADLRPSMKAFILALLPGLEEETSEHFERVSSLLHRLSSTISLSFFLQNLWLVLITGPGYRISAINFLSRRLPPLNPQETIVPVVGQDVGLMIRGYSAALEDGNILVQRGVLDLLLANLKLDSVGFCCDTRHHDRLLLTRAALGVVLRRDLSLSRRLYTWLMGPPPPAEDASTNESKFFQAHGLNLIVESLRQDMMIEYVNAVAERQRPFKVFIALLDKWEIGGPLSRALALDSFRALKLVLKPNDAHDELLLTANMMLDSLDPFITWKSIFESVSKYSSRTKGDDDILALIKFILATFRLHDEEILRIHIPLMATSLICIVGFSIVEDPEFPPHQSHALLEVATVLLQDLPSKFFDLDGQCVDSKGQSLSGLDLARRIYSAETFKEVDSLDLSRLRDSNLCASTFATTLRVIKHFASGALLPADYEVLSASLICIETLLGSLGATAAPIVVDWTPISFTESLISQIKDLELNALGFALFEKTIKVMLSLADARRIQPSLILDDQTILSPIVTKLLDFLQGQTAPFFLQAVKLIWDLQRLTQYRHVETVLAGRLSSPNIHVRTSAFEAFGNLWRLTEDAQLPGSRLRIPMLLVLDGLKSNDLTTRRCAEAWMRCSLKSYLRVLDPLLRVLISTDIKPKPFEQQVGDRSIPIHHYLYPFDQAIVHHTLEVLLTLVRFGGQGFTRITSTCYLRHSHDPSLRKLLQPANLESASYLDALIKVMLLFISSDPQPPLVLAMSSLNQQIHATSADLLQTLVSRGEIPAADLELIEETLSLRLLLLVRTRDYNLQNKLLHALHATMSAGTSTSQLGHTTSQNLSSSKDKLGNEASTANSLFTILVGDGITTQTNAAIVHYWIDFLLMTVPQIRRSLDDVVKPLIDRLVHRLRLLVIDLENTYQINRENAIKSEATDSDFSVLVNALERLTIVSIEGEGVSANAGESSSGKANNERPLPSEAPSGLFAGVFNVLGSSELTQQSHQERPKTEFQIRLGSVVCLLMKAWDVSLQIGDEKEPESSSSKIYFSSRIKQRTRKAFERLYKAVPNDVVESIVDYWDSESDSKITPNLSEDNMFLLLDHLAPSAQTIVSMLYERLAAYGHSAGTEKGRATASTCYLSENIMFSFLESYIQRLEGPIAVQIWTSSWNFARDVLASSATNRNQIFPTLKCFTILAEKISQTSALEDRRMRRDLQDTFVKLCDVIIQAAGKQLEQMKGKPDSNGGNPVITSEKELPTSPSVMPKFFIEEKKTSDFEKPLTATEVALFLSTKALPSCRRFLIESDKLQSFCVHIMYYLVTPALKSRTRSTDLDITVLDLLVEMTRHPAASKAWRTYVAESLSDPKFFNNSPEIGRYWTPVTQALYNTDKERFTEMLSRLSTVPSANIFTNKEAEMVTRSLSLRRITYAIYAAEHNKFLVHLPSIQEKVVDLLRSSVGEIVHAEVYTCMRVLLCRIANQHLGSFWPVILTELTRFFEGIIESIPDSPNVLALALSAAKFLDLLLVLQTEDFQIHQWLFVTDTIDAMYPPDSWYPHAIIDRVSEALREYLANQVSDGRINPISPPLLLPSPQFPRLMTPNLSRKSSTMSLKPPNLPRDLSQFNQKLTSGMATGRKPLLSKIKKIENIRLLERFFSKISLMNYEACYAGGLVDWDTVESDIEADLFDDKENCIS